MLLLREQHSSPSFSTDFYWQIVPTATTSTTFIHTTRYAGQGVAPKNLDDDSTRADVDKSDNLARYKVPRAHQSSGYAE